MQIEYIDSIESELHLFLKVSILLLNHTHS